MEESKFLLVEDVALLFGQQVAMKAAAAEGRELTAAELAAAPPIKAGTVQRYARPRGRYKAKPMPAVQMVKGHLMWFPAEGETIEGLKERLRDWWDGRQGPGRPRTKPVVHAPEED